MRTLARKLSSWRQYCVWLVERGLLPYRPGRRHQTAEAALRAVPEVLPQNGWIGCWIWRGQRRPLAVQSAHSSWCTAVCAWANTRQIQMMSIWTRRGYGSRRGASSGRVPLLSKRGPWNYLPLRQTASDSKACFARTTRTGQRQAKAFGAMGGAKQNSEHVSPHDAAAICRTPVAGFKARHRAVQELLGQQPFDLNYANSISTIAAWRARSPQRQQRDRWRHSKSAVYASWYIIDRCRTTHKDTPWTQSPYRLIDSRKIAMDKTATAPQQQTSCISAGRICRSSKRAFRQQSESEVRRPSPCTMCATRPDKAGVGCPDTKYPHKVLTGRKNGARHAPMRRFGWLPKTWRVEYDAFGVGSYIHRRGVGAGRCGQTVGQRPPQRRHHRRQIWRLVRRLSNCARRYGCGFSVVLSDNKCRFPQRSARCRNACTSDVVRDMHRYRQSASGQVLDKILGARWVAQKSTQIKPLPKEAERRQSFVFVWLWLAIGWWTDTTSKIGERIERLAQPQRPSASRHHQRQRLARQRPSNTTPSPSCAKARRKCRLKKNRPVAKPTYTQVFGKWLRATGRRRTAFDRHHPRCAGSGLVEFEQRFPTVITDVGDAEQPRALRCKRFGVRNIKPSWRLFHLCADQLVRYGSVTSCFLFARRPRGHRGGADIALHKYLSVLASCVAFRVCIVGVPSVKGA